MNTINNDLLQLHNFVKENKFREDYIVNTAYAKTYFIQFRKLVDDCGISLWDSSNEKLHSFRTITAFFHHLYRDITEASYYAESDESYANRRLEILMYHLDLALGTLHEYITTGNITTFALFFYALDTVFYRYYWDEKEKKWLKET